MKLFNDTFVVLSKDIEDLEWKHPKFRFVTKKVFFIAVRDESTGNVLPHPLTDFVITKYEYMNKGVNSQKAAATSVVRFLNFVFMQIEDDNPMFEDLEEIGLRGLKRKHFSEYFSYRSSMNLSITTLRIEKGYLESFYEYLMELNILDEKYNIIYTYNSKDKLVRRPIFESPELRTKFIGRDASTNKVKDFGEHRTDLLIFFLESVRECCPEIALAVALQVFGGLRSGELLNLIDGAIRDSGNGIYLADIQDRQQRLFGHLKSSSGLQVKRPRLQQILPSSLFKDILREHLRIRKHAKLRNKFSLFWNRDGNPMTNDVYHSRFKEAKNHFLNKLMIIDKISDHANLTRAAWSTHIGRGIFTNFLLDMGLNVVQLALARGDRSIFSALDYVDERQTAAKIKEYVNQFHIMNRNHLGIIENTNTFKEELL